MKKAILALLVVFTLSVGSIALRGHKQPVKAVGVAQVKPQAPTRTELLKLVNQERAKYGVAPLKEDKRLDLSAQRKADDEVKYHYFGHISPHDGKHGFEYINDVGIYCKTDSENLHWANLNILSSKETVQGWIGSPAHHKAMIDPEYTLTGFGISGNQVVEHFCQQ
jgi:uncharacterized protein YkwD